MKKTAIVAILLFCLSVSAADTVAVNNLKGSGVPEREARSLTDALRSELGKTGKYQVMERTQMDEILKEQAFQQSGACDDAGCAIEIGKLLDVSQIVMGNVGMVGTTYTVSVRVVEVRTGKILKDFTEYRKGTIDQLLTNVVPMLAQKIAGTYQPKKNTAGWWIAGGVVAAAAIAVPVVLMNRKKAPEGLGAADITVKW
jgi:hypothetical protein